MPVRPSGPSAELSVYSSNKGDTSKGRVDKPKMGLCTNETEIVKPLYKDTDNI